MALLLLSLAFIIATILAQEDLAVVDGSGCHPLDHQQCDELCKLANYWYGHCRLWDGRDFGCDCFPYTSGLDGEQCEGRHTACDKDCRERGKIGGYCYPHPVARLRGGDPRCRCFELTKYDKYR